MSRACSPSGIYQVIARRGERLGIKLHPHMFRHTFAHRWLDAGGAEGDLMELTGWDSPQMLRHYGASARAAGPTGVRPCRRDGRHVASYSPQPRSADMGSTPRSVRSLTAAL
nr:site-specific integrase [Salinispora arenicola]